MRLAAFGLALALLGTAVAVDLAQMPAERARLASRSLLLDLALAGKRLVAVGDRGNILLSDDDGRTWTQTSSPTQDLLTGVCFADAQHGIAVGHDEIILASSDGGQTWRRTHFAPQAQQPLLDVWCGAGGRAIAVGAYGVYLISADYGVTWEERKLEVTSSGPKGAAAGGGAKAADSATGTDASTDDISGGYHLNAIAADSSSRLYVAAEAGHLYRSDDGGNTWKSLPSPYEGSLFGVLPLQGGTVLLYGLRGNLFRSGDSGTTWQRVPTGTEAMLDGATSWDGGGVAIVGLSGVVLLSRDGGSSFSLLQQDDRKGLATVREAQQGTLITVGEAGVKLIGETRQ